MYSFGRSQGMKGRPMPRGIGMEYVQYFKGLGIWRRMKYCLSFKPFQSNIVIFVLFEVRILVEDEEVN